MIAKRSINSGINRGVPTAIGRLFGVGINKDGASINSGINRGVPTAIGRFFGVGINKV